MDLKETIENDYQSLPRHPWEQVRAEVLADILKRHYPALFTHSCALLDFGCGDLFLAEYLQARMPHARIFAIDNAFPILMLHAYNVRYGSGGVPLFVFNSISESLNAHWGPLHAVLLADVLQQSEQPSELIQEISLHPGISTNTLWLVTVPAFKGACSNYDTYLGNKRRYTKAELKTLLQTSGLEVTECGYFFTLPLFARLAGFVNSGPKALSQSGSETGGGSRFIRRLLQTDYAIGNTLRRLKIPLPGLSLYAVCQIKANPVVPENALPN